MERELASSQLASPVGTKQFEEQTPQLIARVAFTNNVLLAIAESLNNRSDGAAVTKFDSLIDLPLPEFATRPSSLRNDPANIEIRGSLTASESRTRKQAIEKLANSAPKQTATRATALRSLIGISRRVIDLDYLSLIHI